MHFIDWTLVTILLVGIIGMAYYTKRYTKSVADFLSANRCAGRYLLSISEGMAGVGAISMVASFEMYYNAGFTASWWSQFSAPMLILISLSGYVIYRYRQTRAMTLAQYFEMRYSKGIRVYAGILAWVSGIVNFGIFPAVGARFFMYFCGIPRCIISNDGGYLVVTAKKVTQVLADGSQNVITGEALKNFVLSEHVWKLFGAQMDLTFIGLMVGLLAVSLFFVFMGGQIAVMVTDFFQGMFTFIAILIIIAFIFYKLSWGDITGTIIAAKQPGMSMLDPFDTSKIPGFNPWFYFIGIFGMYITYMSWQGAAAYNSSAKNAHEARMAKILGSWRQMVLIMAMMLLPIGAWVVMHQVGNTALVNEVNESLALIGTKQLQGQMTVPVVLTKMLPVGIVGMFCAVMLFAFISTHDTYLHSWGSIFIQDVILPFRKKPFTPKQHIWLLRFSIFFVAIFIFLFSLFFQQNQYILMFFAITGAMYAGGTGPVIIFGLYWKRGSTRAAYVSMTIGLVTALTGLVLQNFWAGYIYPYCAENAVWVLDGLEGLFAFIRAHVWGINWNVNAETWTVNGQWFYFFAMVMSLTAYISISLFDSYILRKPVHNMDQLLHRGQYRVEGDSAKEQVTGWRAILPSAEFTFTDKLAYWGNLAWVMVWFVVFVTVVSLRYIPGIEYKFTEQGWANFWFIQVMASIALCVITVVWFLSGGIVDMIDMFKLLKSAKRDALDNGMVHDGHSLTDDELVEHVEEETEKAVEA